MATNTSMLFVNRCLVAPVCIGSIVVLACSSDGEDGGGNEQAVGGIGGGFAGAAGSAAGGALSGVGGVAVGGSAGAPTGGATTTNAGGSSLVASGGSTPVASGGGAPVATGGAGTGTGGMAGVAGTGNVSGAGGDITGSGGQPSPPLENFSFFVTSLRAVRELSGSQDGFGGDLSYKGQSGIAGADLICEEIAESSMPGAGAKGWRAFLSTSSENARDRIGEGPWYDRQGRLIAQNLTNLLMQRPMGADPLIINDLPNEEGLPNRAASAEGSADDNHDMITGSNATGVYAGPGTTCDDWTNKTASGGRPMLGHSWPAFSGMSWIQAHPAPGCVPSVALVQTGPGSGNGIGNAGGYGGFYCFALEP